MLVFLALCCELFYTLIHFIFVDAFNVPDLDHKKNLFRFVFFLWYVCYFLVMQMHAQGVLYCVQILKINLIPVVFFSYIHPFLYLSYQLYESFIEHTLDKGRQILPHTNTHTSWSLGSTVSLPWMPHQTLDRGDHLTLLEFSER